MTGRDGAAAPPVRRDDRADPTADAPGTPSVGVDVGGTKLLAVCLDGGRPTAQRRVPTPPDGPTLLSTVRGLVEDLAPEGPAAVGVALAGLVGAGGTLRAAAHLPALVGFPVAAELAAAFPAGRRWVGNDATAAAWAEARLGAGRGVADVLTVTLGTGIGGGVVSGGRLLGGAGGLAGEWGHMVVERGGPACACGRSGCWEVYASGSGLGRLGRAAGGEAVAAAAAAGDRRALTAIGEYAGWVALGLANLVNIFDPTMLVLGGGVVDSAGLFLGQVRQLLAEEIGPWRSEVEVVAAGLGPAAGAIGAALLAADQPLASGLPAS